MNSFRIYVVVALLLACSVLVAANQVTVLNRETAETNEKRPDNGFIRVSMYKNRDKKIEEPKYTYNPAYAVHTAFGGPATSHVVSWHTSVQLSPPFVIYSLNQTAIEKGTVVNASSVQYLESAGFEHHATITGLTPDTLYHFKCGSKNGLSELYQFRTAVETSKPRTFTIAMYGDEGLFNSQDVIRSVKKLATSHQIDWIYHVGDISYADDFPASYYEVMWNMWFEWNQISMGTVPYMVCPGNHEYSCEHKECTYYSVNFTDYNAKFLMPGNYSRSNTTMWFSFDYSNTHFISLSTETDYPNAPFDSIFGDQVAWLQNDLESNQQRNTTKWIVVSMHRPIYSSFTGFCEPNGEPIGQSKDIQNAFESLFNMYHVDLVIVGHVHSYQRSYPVYQNQVDMPANKNSYDNPKYTTYVVNGAGGNNEGISTNYLPKSPKWSASIVKQWGYSLLKVTEDTLYWTFYNSTNNVVLDQFTITKQ